MTWRRALRALAVAVGLLLIVLFVGENFVVVQVRLFGNTFGVRLAWVVAVPVALAFGAGVLYARSWRRDAAGAAAGAGAGAEAGSEPPGEGQ
jgi:hypothetical protein